MRSRLSPNPTPPDRGHTGCPQGLGTLSPNHRGASLEAPGLPLLPAAHLPRPPAHSPAAEGTAGRGPGHPCVRAQAPGGPEPPASVLKLTEGPTEDTPWRESECLLPTRAPKLVLRAPAPHRCTHHPEAGRPAIPTKGKKLVPGCRRPPSALEQP